MSVPVIDEIVAVRVTDPPLPFAITHMAEVSETHSLFSQEVLPILAVKVGWELPKLKPRMDTLAAPDVAALPETEVSTGASYVNIASRHPLRSNMSAAAVNALPIPIPTEQCKLVDDIQDVVAQRVLPTLAVGVRLSMPKSLPLIVNLGPAVVGELPLLLSVTTGASNVNASKSVPRRPFKRTSAG